MVRCILVSEPFKCEQMCPFDGLNWGRDKRIRFRSGASHILTFVRVRWAKSERALGRGWGMSPEETCCHPNRRCGSHRAPRSQGSGAAQVGLCAQRLPSAQPRHRRHPGADGRFPKGSTRVGAPGSLGVLRDHRECSWIAGSAPGSPELLRDRRKCSGLLVFLPGGRLWGL